MDIGEHFRNLASRLARADFAPEDVMAILNNYAVGVQRALDARECPRCHDFLAVSRDRLKSTPTEKVLAYRCESCKLELSRIELPTVSWWRKLLG